MSRWGKPTKSEIILLGLTAAFLCTLAVLSAQDRQERIPFRTIEQIMEVSGIGEAKFAELKDRITVDNEGDMTNEDSGGR